MSIIKSLNYGVDIATRTRKPLLYVVKKKDGKMQAYLKPIFLRALRRSAGIIKAACAESGVTRSTYMRWYEADPDFGREVDQIRVEQMGEVEDRLFYHIANNEPWAIKFFLSRVHPKYRSKLQTTIQAINSQTLEDLINERYIEQPNVNRSLIEDSEQARADSSICVEPESGLLLAEQNTP